MQNIDDLIRVWPRPIDLARDLGVAPSRITDWKNRDSIPVAYWQRLLSAAYRRGHPEITAALLVKLHTREQKGDVAGFSEEERPFRQTANQERLDVEHESGPQARPTGHFTRFKHLRRNRFRTLKEINDHIDALRDEWSRR